ncbi:MAG TPA: hypothetical protein VFR23_24855 [Jiangellaceae bacterium]|nr:hypothetical protein [Jiangellaceae bacterium]
MRRFEIWNTAGERVGEGVEWSHDVRRARACTYHVAGHTPITVHTIEREALLLEGGPLHSMKVRYLDPPEGEAGKEEAKRPAFDFEAERRSVVENIAAREERMAMGARRTKHRFSVDEPKEEPKEEPKPRKLPPPNGERFEVLLQAQLASVNMADPMEQVLAMRNALCQIFDEQHREREGSG